MRILVDNYYADARVLGAVGIDDLRFVAPVRPNDVLSVETEILGKEIRDDDRGLVRSRVETATDDGRTVLSMVGNVLWERR